MRLKNQMKLILKTPNEESPKTQENKLKDI